MKLIIISGPPASGKTAVAKQIATKLGYEYIGKDQIKEKMYDSESRTTHDYFWYEKKAKQQFFEEIESCIGLNKSILIESNFVKTDKQKLLAYVNDGVTVLEVFCYAKGLTRLKRFVKRNESKERHRGHHDRRWYLGVCVGALLSYIGVWWPYGPLNITKTRMDIDATDFQDINYQDIIEFINKA